MGNSYINFKKQREIGEIISDTFKFIRGNYKSLFTLIIKNTGPAFLILILSAGYYMYVTLGTISMFDISNPEASSALVENMSGFFMAFLLMLCSMMIYFSLLYGTVLHFIKSYLKNDGKVDEEEVHHGARNDFWNLLGAGVLTGIMIFFGLLVCFFPGIYLLVPLSLVFSIIVFEKLSVSESISSCFMLIKNNWWVTFATLLVMWILVYVIGFVFSIPAIFYSLVKGFTLAQENSIANSAEMFDWVYILLNLISTIAQYLLYTITVISTAFIYFNLNEKKNFTGTYESIDNLGQKEQ